MRRFAGSAKACALSEMDPQAAACVQDGSCTACRARSASSLARPLFSIPDSLARTAGRRPALRNAGHLFFIQAGGRKACRVNLFRSGGSVHKIVSGSSSPPCLLRVDSPERFGMETKPSGSPTSGAGAIRASPHARRSRHHGRGRGGRAGLQRPCGFGRDASRQQPSSRTAVSGGLILRPDPRSDGEAGEPSSAACLSTASRRGVLLAAVFRRRSLLRLLTSPLRCRWRSGL